MTILGYFCAFICVFGHTRQEVNYVLVFFFTYLLTSYENNYDCGKLCVNYMYLFKRRILLDWWCVQNLLTKSCQK